MAIDDHRPRTSKMKSMYRIPKADFGGFEENSLAMRATAGVTSKMARTEPKPGDYYLIQRKDGEIWPGVVCDEEMVVKFFKQKNMPSETKQQNGNWPHTIQPQTPGQYVYPMMYMGNLIW